MDGTGIPLITPFDADGELDEEKIRDLVDWVIDNGVDFIVPCGSNSEAELMTFEERARTVEIVVDASSVPVMAGVGHPGLKETQKQLEAAAQAGADGALVVTPFYYGHDQATLANYYRDIADESSIPIYLYSVPAYTDVALAPETVADLSSHENIQGIKDSSGDIQNLQRLINGADSDFDVFVGSGGVYAQALEVGAAGGILALSNVAADRASEIHEYVSEGNFVDAHALNRQLVDLNYAITAGYSVPGLKSAMHSRGIPAGNVRRPFQPVSDHVAAELDTLLNESI